MSTDTWDSFSEHFVMAAGVVYFLASLAYLWQWSLFRRVPHEAVAEVEARELVTAGGAGQSPAQEPVLSEEAEEQVDLYGRIGMALLILAVALHAGAVVSRGFAAGRAPWGNMYEFTLTATCLVGLGFLGFYRRLKLDWLAPVMSAFLLIVLMADRVLLYEPVVALRDSLLSYWLVIHVSAAIIATASFTVGGLASIFYLIKDRWPNTRPGGYLSRLPDLASLDRLAYRTQAFAFPIWTFAALIAGPIWADHAWGSYWNWDPKEVWAFITWVVYAAYLHARVTAGWRGRSAAILALVGLATLWFNFIGINFFFGSGSMHSYA